MDEIVLGRGFDDEIEIQGRTGEPIGDDGDSADDREIDSLLFEETRYEPENVLEIQGRYPTTTNPCFGSSRPTSSPATSRNAASV